MVAFLALSKVSDVKKTFLSRLDTWQATREAIAQVTTKSSVVTTNYIAPYLSQRLRVNLVFETLPAVLGNSKLADVAEFDYVLVNVRHPG